MYISKREKQLIPYYLACPDIVRKSNGIYSTKLVGRKYELFQYYGAPDAKKVIVLMCSGAETVQETVEYLMEKGKVGLVKVRLYRPFSIKHFY